MDANGQVDGLERAGAIVEPYPQATLRSGGDKGDFQTNGEYIAIGRPSDSVNGIDSGQVQLVQVQPDGTLNHQYSLVPPIQEAGMAFGHSTYFVGDLLYVGAPKADVDQAGTGKVYIYNLADPDSWDKPVVFSPENLSSGDEFGRYLTESDGKLGVVAGTDVLYLYDAATVSTEGQTTGQLSFTPLVNQYGTATITVTVEDGGLDGDLSSSNDNATFSRTFDVDVQSVDEDFGDAPAPYPVTTAETGPWHVSTGPRLGTERDSEDDGTHSADATADDTTGTPDDEDGVTFGTIQVGQLDATVTVNVQNAPEGAKLDAWIDFNGDGSWGGPGEQIADTVAVVNGDNTLEFDVPSWAQSGQTFARFRLSTAGDLGIGGPAEDGEVEDVQVTIDPPVAASGLFGSQKIISSTADVALGVFAIDVDGDGDIDVLSASFGDNTIAWYENDGSQNFTERMITTSADRAISVFAIDVDGDGDIDVLSASENDNTIAWYENDGSQIFAEHVITTAADDARSVFAADIDGDGDIDVLSASFGDDTIAWYENDGSQIFAEHVITTTADGAGEVFAADVDGDGDIDVLSASKEDDKIAWYENDGNENFTEHVISVAANGAEYVFAADVDGDGDIDVLSASRFDDKIAWYENDGSQNFTERIITTMAEDARSVFAADVDGDGDIDVLSASNLDDKIAWYENDGSQNFTERIITTAADGAINVFAADVDGDGDIDVLSASENDDTFAWYENNATPTLDAIADLTIEEDADLQTVDLTGITAGGSESQSLRLTSTSGNTGLIPNPTLASTTDGLVAWYPFNGNALDESGLGHDGTVTGPVPTTDRLAAANSAFEFDGIDRGSNSDRITLPDPADFALSTFTVAVWFKWESEHPTDMYRAILDKSPDYNIFSQNYIFYVADDGHAVHAAIGGGGPNTEQYFFSEVKVDDGQWHHAALTFDISSGLGRFYVDGTLEAEQTGITQIATNNSAPLTLGKWGSLGYGQWDGGIDDLYVYDRPLTATEVSSLYSGTGPSQQLQFTPAADQNGTATITVTVEDAGLDGDFNETADNATFDRTFDVTVTPVNDVPVATDASYQLPENSALEKAAAQGLATLVTDVDQDPLTFAVVTAPGDGQLVLNADGSYLYTPATNFNLSDSFTYQANDGTVDSNVATITLQTETSFPWHNGRQPLDVNQDSSINPLDVLVIINLINSEGADALLGTRNEGVVPPFVDVNRDGFRTASDVLTVIDYLNQQAAGESGSGAGEGEATVDPAAMALAVDLLMSQQTGSNEQLVDRSKPQLLGTASPTQPILDNSPYWQQQERRFNHFRGASARGASDISDQDELFDEANWLEGLTEETLQDLFPADAARNN